MTSTATTRRFLFASWDSGGNQLPLLGLVRQLTDRGHAVRVLTEPDLQPAVEQAGAGFHPWRTAPLLCGSSPDRALLRDWEVPRRVAFARLRDRAVCGPAGAYARDILDELNRAPADLIIADALLLGAHLAAERAGLPIIGLIPTIYHYPAPGLPPPGSGWRPPRSWLGRTLSALAGRATIRLFDRGLVAVNQARQALALPPLHHLLDQLTRAHRLLVLTSPAFDFPARRLPANVRYVGPQLDDPAWAHAWTPPWPANDHRPLVLVALSSTYQAHEQLLQHILDALGELPIRGLATLGPALADAGFRVPGNVCLVQSAPHHAVLPDTAGLITHGGHGSVLKALAYGVPVLCLPVGRDQPDIAARLVATGAGLRLPPTAAPAAIRDAVTRLLCEPDYRAAAGRLGHQLHEETQQRCALTELEAAAGLHSNHHRRPAADGKTAVS